MSGAGVSAGAGGEGKGFSVDSSGNVTYSFSMARPPKEPHLRMNTDLRIPVTAEQKQEIMAAVADDPMGFAAWAREILLRAAEKRRAKPKGKEAVSP